MNIGRKRHPIEIQRVSRTQDPVTGEMTTGWATIATEWASLDAISGKEFTAAQATQNVATMRITIGYREDLTPADRFAYHGKKYEIKALLPNNTMTELTCMCEVGVVN